MRVLFVNQTGQMSGAEHSLLTLIDALGGHVEPAAAVPAGDLADALRTRGIPVHPIGGTDASFRLHPLHTPWALGEIARAAGSLTRLTRREGYSLVHANTTRAGLIAAASARAGGPPIVTHVRDWFPPGRLSAGVLRWTVDRASAVIANSQFIAEQLPSGHGGTRIHVVHNPVDLGIFDPSGLDRGAARATIGLGPSDEVLGVVGQLTPWKGQDDAVRIAARLAPRRPGLRLVIAGSAKFAARSTRFDNRAYAARLHDLARELDVEHVVRFLGERDDVPRVLRALDLLLVPSWQEAFGRVAIEGMAMGVPVLATSRGGPPEIVRDRVDGRILDPRDPERWADVASGLLDDPGALLAMGRHGRARAAEAFGAPQHAAAVLAIYRSVLADASRVRRTGGLIRR